MKTCNAGRKRLNITERPKRRETLSAKPEVEGKAEARALPRTAAGVEYVVLVERPAAQIGGVQFVALQDGGPLLPEDQARTRLVLVAHRHCVRDTHTHKKETLQVCNYEIKKRAKKTNTVKEAGNIIHQLHSSKLFRVHLKGDTHTHTRTPPPHTKRLVSARTQTCSHT